MDSYNYEMLLSQFISNFYKLPDKRFHAVNIAKYVKRLSNYIAIDYERMILEDNSKTIINNRNSDTHDFNPDDVSNTGVRKALKHKSGQLALQYVLTSIFATHSNTEQAFNSLIKTLKHIGTGSFGSIYTACIKCEDNIPEVILKINRVKQGIPTMQLEAAIGLCAINPLLSVAPNFNATYAITSCADALCEDQVDDSMLIIERAPGDTLWNVLPYLSNSSIIDVLTQVFLSLQIAYEDCGFTHYDLHASNVLVHEHTQPQKLVYTLHNKTIELSAYYTATIIDYGRATADCDDMLLGVIVFNLGISPEPNPTHDILTLLTACALRLSDTTGSDLMLNALNKLIDFDNVDELSIFEHPLSLRIDYLNALAIVCNEFNAYSSGTVFDDTSEDDSKPSVLEMIDDIVPTKF